MQARAPHATSLRERIRTAPRHSRGEFEAHLEGTAALLRAWGCRIELELAGRYHSVYGNAHGREPLAARETRELIAEIGADAEQLVWLWARLKRASLANAARFAQPSAPGDSIELLLVTDETVVISRQTYLDLVHLHAANELEQATRTGVDCRLLDPLRPLLCAEAVALLDRQPRTSRLVFWCRKLVRDATRAVGAR